MSFLICTFALVARLVPDLFRPDQHFSQHWGGDLAIGSFGDCYKSSLRVILSPFWTRTAAAAPMVAVPRYREDL